MCEPKPGRIHNTSVPQSLTISMLSSLGLGWSTASTLFPSSRSPPQGRVNRLPLYLTSYSGENQVNGWRLVDGGFNPQQTPCVTLNYVPADAGHTCRSRATPAWQFATYRAPRTFVSGPHSRVQQGRGYSLTLASIGSWRWGLPGQAPFHCTR